MGKVVSYLCMRWSTIDKGYNRALPEYNPNSGAKLNVDKRFGVEPLRSIGGLAHVVRVNYGILILSNAHSWPYVFLYMKLVLWRRYVKERKIKKKRME